MPSLSFRADLGPEMRWRRDLTNERKCQYMHATNQFTYSFKVIPPEKSHVEIDLGVVPVDLVEQEGGIVGCFNLSATFANGLAESERKIILQ